MDFLRHVFAHFVVFVYLLCFRQAYLCVFVFHLVVGHYHAVAVDFEVAVFGVYNHVEVFVGAILLLQHAVERVFNHTDECRAVNVFCFLEVLEGILQAYFFLCYFCCHYIFV